MGPDGKLTQISIRRRDEKIISDLGHIQPLSKTKTRKSFRSFMSSKLLPNFRHQEEKVAPALPDNNLFKPCSSPVRILFKANFTMCRRLRINLYCRSATHDDKIPFGRQADDLTGEGKDYLKQTLAFCREGIVPCDDHINCQGSVSGKDDDIQVLFRSGQCNDCLQKKARNETGPRWLPRPIPFLAALVMAGL